MKFLFAIIGLYVGAIMDNWEGAVFGLVIGILAGTLIQYSKRLRELEEKVRGLQSGPAGVSVAPVPAPTPSVKPAGGDQMPAEPEETETPTLLPPDEMADLVERAGEADKTGDAMPATVIAPAAPDMPPPPRPNVLVTFIRDFFTTGNVVVKVGVIVLFFGVAFLLKYAADRNLFPIEFRLSAVAAFGIVLFVTGWRLRHRNLNYALIIQGAAIGVLYLTIFTAARYYTVVPLSLSFFLMLVLVVLTGILAVIQNAMSLAIFATIGGFLAPVLTSTGEGNHVALFSYYAFLNAGIFGIAWYKSWRPLNWTGFVFTFVIAVLWGYDSYRPEYFNTTEPFLILFFLFYVAIAVLYAHRQPPELKGFVDASLVFGTPLVGFTLQAGVVRGMDFGLAYSALALAVFYVLLARFLWNRRFEGMRLLAEAFLALGVIFASLAIPLALDGHWTASAWAVEGGGMIWIGVRQNRLLPRLFGLLLQIGAGAAFLTVVPHPHQHLPVFNSVYLGALLISLAGLCSAYLNYRYRARLRTGEQAVHLLLLIWGLLWWFGSGLMEIDAHLTGHLENNTELFFFAFSMYYLFIAARALEWKPALQVPLWLLPLMGLMAMITFVDFPRSNPFAHYGFISWITAFAVHYLLLYRLEGEWHLRLVSYWHRGSLWLLMFMLAWSGAQAVSHHVPGLGNWGHVMWGFIPAAAVFALIYFRVRQVWPLAGHAEEYLGAGLFPVIVYLALWALIVSFYTGNPAPLPYFPIVNPHELAQLFVLLAIFDWLMRWKRSEVPPLKFMTPDRLQLVLAVIVFVWLNGVVARAVHNFAGVSFTWWSMTHAAVFQASISIVWTLTAFLLMGLAVRFGQRRLWFTGASLLALVVCKLFLVDLADIGTVARIVSFLTVGGLMLVIGYFAPLPQREKVQVG